MELIGGMSLMPYRSGGFVKDNCDMARVYVDMPVVKATLLKSHLKAIFTEEIEQ